MTETPRQQMTPADVLRAAADLIEREGWSQGGNKPGLCVTQATYAVAERDDTNDFGFAADDLFAQFIGTELIVQWNDDPSRTQAEVITTLRAAAEQAEAIQ